MITDREIAVAASESSGDLAEMLHQLLELRRHVRLAVADHDWTTCNKAMPWLSTFAMFEGGGCEWWNCRERAHTIRFQRSAYQPRLLCRTHADEGTQKDYWNPQYIHHARWALDDERSRAADAKRHANAVVSL